MSKLVLMFHGKFHCIKTINVRKNNVVQMRHLTAEIKNNNQIPCNSVIRDRKNISRGNIRKKKLVQSKICEKRKNGAECIRGIKI